MRISRGQVDGKLKKNGCQLNEKEQAVLLLRHRTVFEFHLVDSEPIVVFHVLDPI